MKYRRKSTICSLLAGLMALMYSCARHEPSFELLQSKQIDFPSASAIEYYNNQLFVFGDDAPLLLILSTNYDLLDTVRLVADTNRRISKVDKPDIESATIIVKNNQPTLYGIGSMSGPKRWTVATYNLTNGLVTATTLFSQSTTIAAIRDINIEGGCFVDDRLVLANRANLTNPVNHLVVKGSDSSVVIKKLSLPTSNTVAGISGLYYVKEKDILLFTASEEATANSYEDGEIGESYLGWIENFASKLKEDAELTPDKYVKLTTVNKSFTRQKIESVCVEKVQGNDLLLHLVADNDKGDSHLFGLRVKM